LIFPDGTASFRALSLDDGAVRTLVQLDDPRRIPPYAFYLHGNRIYYVYGELVGNIWVMNLIH